MSGPFGSSQWMYASGAEEGQSLRFEDGDSAYLSFTPASAGNRKTWTWSGWVKLGNLSIRRFLFSGGTGTADTTNASIEIHSDNTLKYQTGSTVYRATSQVFRDPSAFYHIVVVFDSTDSTADDRCKFYINGEQVTSFATNATITQNTDYGINRAEQHQLGSTVYNNSSGLYLDGYLANVAFIDGTALDADDFGEYDGTLWKPKSDDDITSLTFGTNGFYLPFKQTTEAEGFSTVTYTGTSAEHHVEGVGFEPDFVWIKSRTSAESHWLYDSVRGVDEGLKSNASSAENSNLGGLEAFESSGFELGTYDGVNDDGFNYVAWCWDAGSGSAASNTDGSITSSVKANTTNGFSIATYTGTGANATVGHGLSSAPEMVILKNRSRTNEWPVFHQSLGATKQLFLDLTQAEQTASTYFNDTAPTSSVFSVGTNTRVNHSGDSMVAYCFHSVSGYSKIGSYSGTGSSGNSITGLGFKPAWLMIKRTDNIGNWWILDNTRDVIDGDIESVLLADSSGAEFSTGTGWPGVDFTSDGFDLNATAGGVNASGGSYIYMAFADTRDATFFGDTSGNSNNWTPNALNNTDVVLDAPVTGGNFATMNPLWQTLGTVTHSEGNLKTTVGANAHQAAVSTFTIPSTGKWYWEMRLDSKTYSTYTYGYGGVGATTGSSNAGDPSNWVTDGTQINWRFPNNSSYNKVYGSGSINLFGATDQFADEDIISFAYDADNKRLYLAQNGSWFLSADPSTNTGDSTAIWYGWSDAVAGTHQFFEYWGYFTYVTSKNFGQDSSFIGQVTPQGNTDDNGVGDFYYAPPSGYLALTTGNLPTPDITAPDDYFNTVLYTGTGASNSITVGFQPDWVWAKRRSSAASHGLVDAVRGAGQTLFSNLTDVEDTGDSNLTSFDTNGFTAGTGGNFNTSGQTYVAWNWLAGNGTSSNTDGDITSTVSANTTAGFSVATATYTGSGSSQSFGHGLGVTPDMIIIKDRDTTASWGVWHKDIGNYSGNTPILLLNATNATLASGNYMGTIDSSVASVSSGLVANNNDFVAYMFAEVEGYSKIGSYTGNGSTDGTFVHCGFRPAWVLIKSTGSSSNGWYIYDNKRENYGTLVDAQLYANLSNAEDNGNRDLDFTSNGFKPRLTDTNVNGSGSTYIFLAFAEAPFKSANAR